MRSHDVRTTGGTPWPFLQVGPLKTATTRRIEHQLGAGGEKVELDCANNAGTCAEHLSMLADEVDLSSTGRNDLIANDGVVRALDDLEARVTNQPKLLQAYAFASRGGNQPGIAAIFNGAEGVGRTTAARVLAKRLERPLYQVTFDAVVGDTAAQTLKRLSEAVDLAAACGAILLIPDLDTLTVPGGRGHGDRDAKLIATGLAQKLRSQCGVVLMTSNGCGINADLTDALSARINFSMPEQAERLQLWQRAFPEDMPVSDLPFEAMSRNHGLSGSQICQAALRAASKACSEQRNVSPEDIKAAVGEIYAATGRIIRGNEFNY